MYHRLWNIAPVNRIRQLVLGLLLSMAALPCGAAGIYDDNPFVEAMLRMMAAFGLINQPSLPLGVPYLPSYGNPMMPGVGGMPGFGYPGMNMLPGAAAAMPGYANGYAGQTPFPWSNNSQSGATSGYLDGIWELSSGSVVIIRRDTARLYLSRDRYQDFSIGYDQGRFWWTPRGGSTTTQYRYQMRDGRMVIRDNEGKVLLMRRRS